MYVSPDCSSSKSTFCPLRGRVRNRARAAAGINVCALLVLAPPAAAQTPAPPPVLSAPAVRATGVTIPLRVGGTAPGAPVEVQRHDGGRWITIKSAIAGAAGSATLTYLPTKTRSRYRLRAVSAGLASPAIVVRTRDVTVAAFGDVNFGDGVLNVMDRLGALHPWRGVGPTLRRADIAFGNLECAVSRRGAPVPKQFTFRGRPEHLSQAVRFAGIDVLNLANNHVGDYGTAALLDTVRAVRRAGAQPVGAGATLGAARRPRVVTRLGLKVAFVGFSDIGPPSFFASPGNPGTSSATFPAIAASVRAARREADVVIATFHWGVERATTENARQQAFAQAALRAGASAVIGAHPHVLQPIRRIGPPPRRLIAYSLGNFVWSASSAATSRTGILRLALSARGVQGARLLPAVIESTRPRLLR
jgi:poly-gamma-glutamate capsule biosynthesis protein CapA/YwtB (metallophosphatase superfamily)